MTHKHFQNLTPLEQKEYIGSLVIAVETSEYLFDLGTKIIEQAEQMGIYQRTKVSFEPTKIDAL